MLLTEFSPLVPDDVQEAVEAKEKEILDGTFDVFCGPINDQDGNEAVAAGECMSDGDMLGMSFFVEGVVGEIPE